MSAALKRIKNILVAGATDERVAATTAVDEHTAAMADSTSSLEALRAAREHFTAQRTNTGGMLIARENEDVRTLLDRVKESNIATSAHTQQACAPVDTTHMTLGNSGLGARAGDERVVAMECEIMSEREDGEQSMGAGQHTTGASKEMTQESPSIALADEDAPIPPVTPHDTLADNGRAKVQGSTPTSGRPYLFLFFNPEPG